MLEVSRLECVRGERTLFVDVNFRLDGGELLIEWREDNHIYKTGPATEVFRGEYLD